MLERFEQRFVALNRWILIVLMLAMSVVVFANVVLRYTTGDSLVWAEEVARHLMIWGTFLGAGLVLRFGGHLAIDSLLQAMPARLATALRVTVVALMAVFCCAMVYSSAGYTYAMRFQTTPATGISFACIYAAIPAGFVLLLIHLALVARTFCGSGAYLESPEMDAEAAASL